MCLLFSFQARGSLDKCVDGSFTPRTNRPPPPLHPIPAVALCRQAGLPPSIVFGEGAEHNPHFPHSRPTPLPPPLRPHPLDPQPGASPRGRRCSLRMPPNSSSSPRFIDPNPQPRARGGGEGRPSEGLRDTGKEDEALSARFLLRHMGLRGAFKMGLGAS